MTFFSIPSVYFWDGRGGIRLLHAALIGHTLDISGLKFNPTGSREVLVSVSETGLQNLSNT